MGAQIIGFQGSSASKRTNPQAFPDLGRAKGSDSLHSPPQLSTPRPLLSGPALLLSRLGAAGVLGRPAPAAPTLPDPGPGHSRLRGPWPHSGPSRARSARPGAPRPPPPPCRSRPRPGRPGPPSRFRRRRRRRGVRGQQAVLRAAAGASGGV